MTFHVHWLFYFLRFELIAILLGSAWTLWKWREWGWGAWPIVFRSEARIFELAPRIIAVNILGGLVDLLSHITYRW